MSIVAALWEPWCNCVMQIHCATLGGVCCIGLQSRVKHHEHRFVIAQALTYFAPFCFIVHVVTCNRIWCLLIFMLYSSNEITRCHVDPLFAFNVMLLTRSFLLDRCESKVCKKCVIGIWALIYLDYRHMY